MNLLEENEVLATDDEFAAELKTLRESIEKDSVAIESEEVRLKTDQGRVLSIEEKFKAAEIDFHRGRVSEKELSDLRKEVEKTVGEVDTAIKKHKGRILDLEESINSAKQKTTEIEAERSAAIVQAWESAVKDYLAHARQAALTNEADRKKMAQILRVAGPLNLGLYFSDLPNLGPFVSTIDDLEKRWQH